MQSRRIMLATKDYARATIALMSWYAEHIEEMDARKDGIDIREVRYMEARSQGLTGAQSAQKAGYGVAKQRSPGKLIETPELKQRMQQSLIRKRVTLDSIAETVANSLQANVIATTKEGDVIESTVADHKVRLKGAEQAGKLWGLAEGSKDAGQGSVITLTLAGPLAERIAARMAQAEVVVLEGE